MEFNGENIAYTSFGLVIITVLWFLMFDKKSFSFIQIPWVISICLGVSGFVFSKKLLPKILAIIGIIINIVLLLIKFLS
jgi:hypothetical protein